MSISRWKIVTERYKRFGLWRCLLFMLHVLINKIVYFNMVRAVRLSGCRDAVICPEADDIEVELISEERLLDVAEPGRHEMTREFISKSFKKGDRCLAVLCDGELASYSWFSNGPTAMNEQITFHVGQDHIYMFKSFTDPKYRGRKLHGLIIDEARRICVRSGSTGIIAAIEYTNFPSLNSFLGAGAREIGKIFFIRVLGRLFTFASPGCRRLRFVATVRETSWPLKVEPA